LESTGSARRPAVAEQSGRRRCRARAKGLRTKVAKKYFRRPPRNRGGNKTWDAGRKIGGRKARRGTLRTLAIVETSPVLSSKGRSIGSCDVMAAGSPRHRNTDRGTCRTSSGRSWEGTRFNKGAMASHVAGPPAYPKGEHSDQSLFAGPQDSPTPHRGRLFAGISASREKTSEAGNEKKGRKKTLLTHVCSYQVSNPTTHLPSFLPTGRFNSRFFRPQQFLCEAAGGPFRISTDPRNRSPSPLPIISPHLALLHSTVPHPSSPSSSRPSPP